MWPKGCLQLERFNQTEEPQGRGAPSFGVLVWCLLLSIIAGISLPPDAESLADTSSPMPSPSPTSTPWVWWSDNPDALAITLSTDKATYKLDEDILVKIQETNTSNDAIAFSHVGAPFDYDLYISHGTTLLKPVMGPWRRGCEVPFSGRFRGPVLSPGQTLVECGASGDYTPISGWGFKLTEAGTYYIFAASVFIEQSKYPNGRYWNDAQLSNVVEVTVQK